MRVFNKKLNRLLAIMLASVMGATSLPATQVSADTPSSEYDISNDAASDDISDSKIPDEQDSDNNATEEKQPQQLTVEYTPADDIYVGNKVVPVVKSDRADAAVDNLKYTVVEGKNLIEKDTDFASNGIWTAKDTGTVRIKVTKAEDDKYKSAEAEYTVTIKEYDYSSMNNSLTGTMLQGTKFYVEAPILSLASDNQAVYVVRKGDEWIEADKYQLMPQQGDNRQTLVIARKDKESGAITDIGSLQLDYKYDTQPPKITLNPKEDDKPAFTKDAVDYYGNVRKVDMNIHDVSLDDGSTQLWVKVDDREEFDVFDVDNAQKLIDAGIEYSDWIVTGADYSSCITFGTKADEEHKYQIIRMYAKDQAEHECNDTSSIEQPFYVDRKAPSGTIGYDADLIDEQNMVSQQASNVYGQLEDISGIKQAFYYVNKSDESGSILNDEQVKALDDSAWKPLELIEDTYDARYKYKIIGSAQSGKTNLLQTIIRGVAENYTPQEVNLYIIDFGSMILRNYANLNHCGGVVCSDDDEKLKNLFKLLNKEINLRKEKLAEIGVSSFFAYKEAGKTDLPQIIVLIDNMTALKEMYLQDIDYLLPLFRDGIAVGMTFVVANLQTSGIGQRYLSNFEGRITLFCNDSSEYSMMLNGVRLSIPNTPGRCMVQLDKEVLEAQLFISFEGEKEYERVQKIKSFVDEQNDKYINQKAKVIPEIPKELTLTYIQSQFTESISDDKVIIGLDYTSILPVAVELKSGDVLSLTGKNQTDRETFAKYFMDTIVQKASGNTELYVLDDATKKMGECEFNPNTAMYLTSYHDVPPMIEEINQRIEQRYEMYSAGMFDELEMEPWIILVIDSADIMLNMSGDNKIMKYMKDWLGKYKNMKIFVFMPDIENNSISFNSPEMLKIVKDNRHYMVFDDVCNIKICDISVSASKKYSKPIETGDAYYIKDNELVKIKVVRQS